MSLYPTTPKFAATSLSSMQPTLVSRSQSGKRSVRKLDGHLWSFTASYPPMTRETFMPVYAFGLEQDGQYGTFTVCPPNFATPRGSVGGTPLVNGADQTGTTLDIDGCDALEINWGMKGDIFTVAGDLKVYILTQDIDTDVAGDATLTFRPALESSPADGAALTFTNVVFTMAYSSNVREAPCNIASHYSYEVDLVEAV